MERGGLEDAFHRIADERWAEILATGETVPWDQAKAWLGLGHAGSARPIRWRASWNGDPPQFLPLRSEREAGYKHDG